MKQSVLDVLMYLFETYLDAEFEPEPDHDALREELELAGFHDRLIDRALQWLDELSNSEQSAVTDDPNGRALRVFNRQEQERLDVETRGYLMYLEQIGILSPSKRELVLERLMALGSRDIDVEQAKWVVLMVLFTQPGQEDEFARMEDLLFDGPASLNH